MSDIVENRKRISLRRKLRLATLALRENGLWWCILLFTYYASSSLAHRAFSAMDGLRRKRNIPGMNSAALNKEIWESWDWSSGGDEWSESEQWKQSVIRRVLQGQIQNGSSILEIGPGAGRWTEPLLGLAREYIGIDISSSCIAHCRARFAGDSRAKFHVGSGSDLAAVADRSIDAIWSFDVFVHINSAEVDGYIRDFARVLRPGGVAIVHHGAVGGAGGGWRSNLTFASFEEIVRRHHLHVKSSFAQWADEDVVYQVKTGDLITVISNEASPRL